MERELQNLQGKDGTKKIFQNCLLISFLARINSKFSPIIPLVAGPKHSLFTFRIP